MYRNGPKHKHQAVRNWYERTQDVAAFLGALFQAVFPDYYAKFRQAFEAGRWIRQDPGRWMMRCVVWKLDVLLHQDRNDGGPTATFPAGFFSEGHMEVPQLKARFR